MIGFEDILQVIILLPGAPVKVGILIGVAIIIGYVLFDDGADVIKLLITGATYIFFQEWVRTDVLVWYQGDMSRTNAIFSAITVVLFAFGIAVGGFMANVINRRQLAVARREQEIIEDIKRGRVLNPEKGEITLQIKDRHKVSGKSLHHDGGG